jgi:hypothetical protein
MIIECIFISAHSAFDLVEFGHCLQKAYEDCKVVEILNKFTNFTHTVNHLLNPANTTPGADHFSEFRYFQILFCSVHSTCHCAPETFFMNFKFNVPTEASNSLVRKG